MKQYTAVQGDTWDYISWKLYQNEGYVHTLLAVNPALRHIVQFETSTIIYVPDIPEALIAANNLPPWKRG
jgi:phage tail protein X